MRAIATILVVLAASTSAYCADCTCQQKDARARATCLKSCTEPVVAPLPGGATVTTPSASTSISEPASNEQIIQVPSTGRRR
jgi:hypothetical protein